MTVEDFGRPLNADPPDGDATGYATIAIAVRGRLDGGPEREITIVIRAFTDGLSCGNLGAATVAVVGFDAAGGPQLLTDSGELTVNVGALRVGCPECGQLLDSAGQAVSKPLRSPSWDLTEVGLSLQQLSYQDDGTVLVQDEYGCLALPRVGRFARVASLRCTPMTALGHYRRPALGRTLAPAEWIFQAPGRLRALFLEYGACT